MCVCVLLGGRWHPGLHQHGPHLHLQPLGHPAGCGLQRWPHRHLGLPHTGHRQNHQRTHSPSLLFMVCVCFWTLVHPDASTFYRNYRVLYLCVCLQLESRRTQAGERLHRQHCLAVGRPHWRLRPEVSLPLTHPETAVPPQRHVSDLTASSSV